MKHDLASPNPRLQTFKRSFFFLYKFIKQHINWNPTNRLTGFRTSLQQSEMKRTFYIIVVKDGLQLITLLMPHSHCSDLGHDWLWFHFLESILVICSHLWSILINRRGFGGKFKFQTCRNFHYDYFCRRDRVVNRNGIGTNLS